MDLFTGQGQALVFVTFTGTANRVNIFFTEICDDAKDGAGFNNFTYADVFYSRGLQRGRLRRGPDRIYTSSFTSSGTNVFLHGGKPELERHTRLSIGERLCFAGLRRRHHPNCGWPCHLVTDTESGSKTPVDYRSRYGRDDHRGGIKRFVSFPSGNRGLTTGPLESL